MSGRDRQWRTNRFWIFDMDGTLTRAKHDFPAIKRALGISPNRGILESFAEMDPGEVAELMVQLDEIESEIAATSEIAEGALPLLVHIADRGDRLGILTRNSRANALITLRAIGLLDFFEADCILGRSEASPKPDPDGVNRLLSKWRAARNLTALVGDNRFDVLTGQRAGIRTILVNHHRDRSDSADPDLWIRDLGDLLSFLRD